jgi:L-amino acid N-acyltransferase YncA
VDVQFRLTSRDASGVAYAQPYDWKIYEVESSICAICIRAQNSKSALRARKELMAKIEKLEASLIYPREVTTRDGRVLSLRLMELGDKQRVLNFARALPPDDLLFLRTDITDPAIIDEWVNNIDAGITITLLAIQNSHLVGYASLHTDGPRWTRRVGEVRVQVALDYRGVGLGKRLIGEIFRLGQDLGLKKMAALMTPEQTGARASFAALGFRVEATLEDWVVDRTGVSRNLIIMSLVCES